MTPAERARESLIDAIAFAFVSVAVQQLERRPSMRAIASFRQLVANALDRAQGPFGGDEPTEPSHRP